MPLRHHWYAFRLNVQQLSPGGGAAALIGHGWVLDFLRRSVADRLLHHAYLLTGPTHIGKLTTAVAMAQVLTCIDGAGCGRCRNCQLVERRIHPDLKLLQLPDERRNIPIKDVHEFMQGMALKPLEAPRKVYIVDQADMLQEDGANALLKTLEEPPPAVALILTATDPARLLPTVVSRCQRIALRPVATQEIGDYLRDQVGLAADQAEEISRASHGLPGWAILAASDEDVLRQREACARDLLDLLRSSRLERVKYADGLAERWSGHNDQVISTLEIWIDTWRDMARVEALEEALPTSEMAKPLNLAGRALGATQARAAIEATLDAVEALRANAHPRLTLETLLLFWPRVTSGVTDKGPEPTGAQYA